MIAAILVKSPLSIRLGLGWGWGFGLGLGLGLGFGLGLGWGFGLGLGLGLGLEHQISCPPQNFFASRMPLSQPSQSRLGLGFGSVLGLGSPIFPFLTSTPCLIWITEVSPPIRVRIRIRIRVRVRVRVRPCVIWITEVSPQYSWHQTLHSQLAPCDIG